MNRRVIIIRWTLVVLAVVVAVYSVRAVIRQFIVQPIFQLGWNLYQVYAALPQQWVWSGLVFVGVLLGVQALSKGQAREELDDDTKRYYPSRVETWERWLDLADKGELYRLKLARELSDLTLSTLANREGESMAIVRRNLQNGGILLPEESIRLINFSPQVDDSSPILKIIHRFTRKDQRTSILTEVEETVKYLESELEVGRGESSA